MNRLDHFPFRRRKARARLTCVVVICSVKSGMVRRKAFSSFPEAQEYAQKWRDKNAANGRTYDVSIQPI